MKKIAFVLLTILNMVGNLEAFGQNVKSGDSNVIKLGEKYSFHSDVLEENRDIWVKLPQGYSENDTISYPVVYLLDGAGNFSFTSGLLDQLEIRSVPKSILVGIINTNRTRDLTPSNSDEVLGNDASRGGAHNFNLMLEKELIPLVDEKFRTKDFKTLIGHSYGGLFIIHSITQSPRLFNAYIAISPSLFWDDQNVVSAFEKMLNKKPDISGSLFMTMANEKGTMLGGLYKIVGILESINPKNFRWGYKIYKDEHHGSVPVISQVDGFHFIYDDLHFYSPYEVYEEYGIAGLLEGLKLRSKRINERFGIDWQYDDESFSDFLYTLNEKGQYKDALKLSKELIESGKQVVEFYEAAGKSYYSLGDKEKAIKFYKEAFILNPGYIEVGKMLDSLGIEKNKLKFDPTLSKSQLEKYEGTYVGDRSNYVVQFSGDSLFLSAKDEYFSISKGLVYMGTDSFYVPNDFFTVHFVKKKDKIVGLKIRATSGWKKELVKKGDD